MLSLDKKVSKCKSHFMISLKTTAKKKKKHPDNSSLLINEFVEVIEKDRSVIKELDSFKSRKVNMKHVIFNITELVKYAGLKLSRRL